MANKNAGKLFGLLGIIFVLIAFFIWYKTSNRPIEVPAQRTANQIESYTVQTTKGKWIDTGVWVEPNRLVQANAPDIFTLAVDSTEANSILQDSKFYANIKSYPCSVPDSDAAYVTNQGKIYLYAEKSITINFFIIGAPKDPCKDKQ